MILLREERKRAEAIDYGWSDKPKWYVVAHGHPSPPGMKRTSPKRARCTPERVLDVAAAMLKSDPGEIEIICNTHGPVAERAGDFAQSETKWKDWAPIYRQFHFWKWTRPKRSRKKTKPVHAELPTNDFAFMKAQAKRRGVEIGDMIAFAVRKFRLSVESQKVPHGTE